MTDQLDSRVTGAMTAFLGDDEHPAWRADTAPRDLTDDESARDDLAPDVFATEPVFGEPEADGHEADGHETVDVTHAATYTATGTIVLPTPEVLADPRAVAELVALHDADVDESELGFPAPPRRGSLDDDVLVPLVGRHTDDTATIDLIGILQAQMQLRSREAATFADWEERMRQIGTHESIGEVERTRLHFTGVIPIQAPAPVVTVADAVVPLPALVSAPAGSDPVIAAGTAPSDDTQPTATSSTTSATGSATTDRLADARLLERPDGTTDRLADARLLERPDEAPAAATTPTSTAGHPTPLGNPVVATVSIVAALVIVAALIVSAVTGSSTSAPAALVGLLAAVAVIAGAWVGIVLGRVALRSRAAASTREAQRRGLWALVAGLVVGTLIGEGLVRSTSAAFAWQGYLLKAFSLTAVDGVLSVVVGVVAASVVGFVAIAVFLSSPERDQRAETPAA